LVRVEEQRGGLSTCSTFIDTIFTFKMREGDVDGRERERAREREKTRNEGGIYKRDGWGGGER
jgi:hypothetical protein